MTNLRNYCNNMPTSTTSHRSFLVDFSSHLNFRSWLLSISKNLNFRSWCMIWNIYDELKFTMFKSLTIDIIDCEKYLFNFSSPRLVFMVIILVIIMSFPRSRNIFYGYHDDISCTRSFLGIHARLPWYKRLHLCTSNFLGNNAMPLWYKRLHLYSC